MAVKLTQGCIEAIMRGENIEMPVVQFLGHKRMTTSGNMPQGGSYRVRVNVSDGIHFNTFAILSIHLNNMIEDGELQENSIIRLDQYSCNEVPSSSGGGIKNVLLISKLTILMKGDVVGTKIGTPVKYEEIDSTQQSTAATPMEASTSHHTPARVAAPVTTPMTGQNENVGRPQENKHIQPIVALNPYQNRWFVKARVLKKGPIRTWSKSNSDGKVFNLELGDASGAIRVTAFGDACDKFYDMMELNKVFLISRCEIKPANKKFSTNIPHDFELFLKPDSIVEPCDGDDRSVHQLQFNFTPLNALKSIAVDSLVDIVGICKEASDLQNVVARSTKNELKKREITLVDMSDASFNVTLWNTVAENFDTSNNPVVAIKGAKMTEFRGSKSASAGQTTKLEMNPDIPEAHQLRGWYDSLDSNHEFNSISSKIENGRANRKLWTLKEALLNQAGGRNETDYFNVEAIVSFIRSESAIYLACPTKDCKKKVVDNNNGTYRCEKCNQEFPNFNYGLTLNVQICDWTGNQWITLFQEQAEALLGATATEIGRSRDDYNDAINYDNFFRRPRFKNYSFRVGAKMENFNNENRLKMRAINLEPIDYKRACKRMITEIKMFPGVSIAAQ